MGIGTLSESLNSLLDLPDETLSTVLTLYRADIAAERTRVNKDSHDKYDDYTESILTAVEMQLDELEGNRIVQRDARLARSIVDAKLSDLRALTIAAEEEKQAAADHQYARRLAGTGNAPPLRNSRFDLRQNLDNAFADKSPIVSKLAGLYISREAGKALYPSTDDTDATEREVQCSVCLNSKSYFEVTTTACGHHYCKPCIQQFFRDSFKDDTLFPPRCCKQHIDPDAIKIFMTRAILERFEEKMVEFNTMDKTYCSNKVCAAFIMPATISGDVGQCTKCGTLTCAFCKSEAHGEKQCEEDPALKAVIALAETEGWRRCSQCKTMIELRMGCYHMTCTCGNEFCYLCGATPWKTCGCAQWDERRLEEQTDRVRVRQGRVGAEQQAIIRGKILQRHNCTHERWRGCSGGQCDECGHDLPMFLYRCQGCHVEMCRRCRFNRVR